jgi:hypothetical protein
VVVVGARPTLTNLAELERGVGRLDEAETHAARAFDLAVGLGDRLGEVFAAAELAAVAALRDDGETAGLLWAAIEGETDAAPVGQWPRYRETYAPIVRRAAGEAFESGCKKGASLSLVQAVATASQTEP